MAKIVEPCMSVFVKGFGNVKQKTHTVYEEERPTFPLIEKTRDGLSTTTTKVNRFRCINMLVSASPRLTKTWKFTLFTSKRGGPTKQSGEQKAAPAPPPLSQQESGVAEAEPLIFLPTSKVGLFPQL